MSGQKSRVCVIGAGPCGMSTLFQFDQLGDSSPEVVCYEKQDTWLGMWNFTWITGTDEYGEPCHNGMYKNLWSNGPKEVLEFPDYTFDDYFRKATPSYPPRLVIRNYMEERLVHKSKVDLKRYIKWNTVVRQVRYHKDTDNFTVTSEDLRSRHTFDETFTHVIVATGIFNVPNKPYFPGIETFSGRILHAHDFRDAAEFKDHRILVIGGSYSAEDIALQSLKYGAKSIVISYRSKPMNFKWPSLIEERPLVTKIHKNKIHFKDGTEAEVDSIVLCTGYKYQFTFMDDDLRLYSNLSLYPEGLYKGSVWMKNGNDKLFYIGVQDQYYTFTMFDVQAMWICNKMSKLTKEDKDAIKKTYRAMDENGDGRVSKAEVKRASKRLGINFSDAEINKAMGAIDENDDGYLNYNEFEKMILDHIEGEAMEMKIIRKIFRTMDVDGDGKVTCKEIAEALKISKDEAQELLLEADTNKDGKMSFEEFVNVYRGKNG